MSKRQISLYVDETLLHRADRLVPHLKNLPAFSALPMKTTRSVVLRYAMALGLEQLETEADTKRERGDGNHE